ncbi:hypothetical protein PsorP6_005974 [Peronosclerospora sorghi]|uniref:Uncharacterized protein n=1 Tax=Peronosclerospora sorghi TaxID=230839 RepID=A0ACC0W4N9_9STRA|nr:hypothetical protein PsorP6_005974 [Peronosclerospora sorghi]
MSSTKRSYEAGDGQEQLKRARRSRWGQDDDKESESSLPSKTSPSPKALDEIVKRLSSVVKKKRAPEELQALAAAASRPLIGAGGQLDAQAARARALAQASLLALNLPGTNISPNDLARRLYIGNLYYDLKEEDIRNAFAPFGLIHSIDLSLEPGASRSKGFCFLEYEDVLAAESAVQVLNGAPLANRSIRVGRPHRGNTNPNNSLSIGQEAIKNVPTKCVYIANVRIELNSQHLELYCECYEKQKSIFSPFGAIRACVMVAVSPMEPGVVSREASHSPKRAVTNLYMGCTPLKHREYGFMEFVEESCALSAIQHMNGFELAGQALKVGKASETAMLINLATSKDKVVRQNPIACTDMVNGTFEPVQETAFAEDDVEGVKDVDPGDDRCCLCLVNLVKCGEVDKELEDEVRGECGKFGVIKKVEIHELANHVRVFVLFADAVGASKAKHALHGRFFGGNQVQAHYYSLHALQLQHYTNEFL